jgi:hypothetical protein
VTPEGSVPVLVGVHPSWLPDMDAPPLPVKSAAWPDTDQPGEVFRVSDTVTWVVAAVALLPLTASVTVSVVSTVRVKEPPPVVLAGTVTAIGIVPGGGTVPDGKTVTMSVRVEALKAVWPAGVNTAFSLFFPAAGNIVVVVATPLELRATGEPISVPPTSNCTVPAGVAVPLTAFTVAVKVTV